MRMDELSAIPQSSRELALHRFELLRPHLEGFRPLRAVSSEASIPYRTALRWASGYRRVGLAALARRRRSDQGGRRLASITLIKAIEGLALERPPLPISSIHRQASSMAETLQERKPSYAVGTPDCAQPASKLANARPPRQQGIQQRLRSSPPAGSFHAQLNMEGRSRPTRHQVAARGWLGRNALADDCH